MIPFQLLDCHSKRGVEETRTFFPASSPMLIHFNEIYSLTRGGVVSIEEDHSANSCRGIKHSRSGESELVEEKEEERCMKRSATNYKEEDDLSEVFDKVLLCTDDSPSVVGKQLQKERSGCKGRAYKRGDGCEFVNMESLLFSCAKSIAAASYKVASEQLKMIRQYSSPVGDANQRLAHAFANGLEARLAGSEAQLHVSLSSKNDIVVPEMQKSRISSSLPFMRILTFFANKIIYEVASRGASLHVIDFGILQGVQWPTLIQELSQRPGGPPKLRITGIELPQPGFRPAQMVLETGMRLAKYCQRFGVPFEYNSITAKNWEAIKINDLKLEKGEVVAVNCTLRLKRLLDETVCGADNPRDGVLNLIRQVNPHIFVHSVVNASWNSPFFVNRFRSALYYFSTVYDMLEAVFPRHDSQRFNLEQALMGPGIANIIGCEGMERLDRPETYMQWQSRIMRAGFKPVPLNPQLVKKLRSKAREAHHKDFLFAEDGPWVLQGWKGQIFFGSCAWVTHNQNIL
ncbi:unnamed protein product [Cuscuta epithymum]|uniref:Uncharacterized protein n=1 Tax=Cuscuta epithymum TaxID=186058 RepID=A0AAV0DX41_9ASTE|nr:unnamed protein product [Cuscuta epithymum]CAH9133981.1 unnamed protein product [Cuscuta epithymum]